MPIMSRRSVVRTSLGGAAAWTLARPYIAHAAATTATVWWVQGFAEEEDVSFKKIVADYEKVSGNTIDYSIIPYAPERQKIVSAMTSGVVPDLFQNNPFEIVALYAWDDKLVDVSDVVATQKEEYTEAALLSAYCFNRIEKRRSFYGVPYTASVSGNHIWGSLVQKAGYSIEDIPKTWDAFYDFFKGVQRKLREQGMRHVYGLGFQVTTNGADPNSTFNNFLIAYAALQAALVVERAKRIEEAARAARVEAELAVAKAKASDDQAVIAHQQLQIAKLTPATALRRIASPEALDRTPKPGSRGPARVPGPIWPGCGTGGGGLPPPGALGPIGRAGGPSQTLIGPLYNEVKGLAEIQPGAPLGAFSPEGLSPRRSEGLCRGRRRGNPPETPPEMGEKVQRTEHGLPGRDRFPARLASP